MVIAGAGQAGSWAARTLRREGFCGRIVLLGGEAHPPYERPPLSKAVLAGEMPPERTQLLDAAALAQLSIEWRGNTPIAGIAPANRQVTLAQGAPLTYDALIFCTGGRARPLLVGGVEPPGLYGLRTFDDALALRAALRPGVAVVVIGGGWIGLEVAAACRQRGAQVVVIDAARRLCERSLPPDMSTWLAALHAAQGVKIVLNAVVSSIAGASGGKRAVRLQDGRELIADLIVAGVGLAPNDALARAAGLACAGGVLVDEQCRTSDPHIFAAGDVAVSYSEWAGQQVRLESWQNAQEQGICAAQAALGQAVRYQPLPWFWSDQYGNNLQIYGFPTAAQKMVIREQPDHAGFLRFYLEGRRVRSAVGVNAGRALRVARQLIERGQEVDAARLADAAVPLTQLR